MMEFILPVIEFHSCLNIIIFEVSMAPVLKLRGITKRFPGVLANDSIDFALEQSEIYAMLGENGAENSTLRRGQKTRKTQTE
jgi:ABC-type uncharacterized transport system ATPase subunit